MTGMTCRIRCLADAGELDALEPLWLELHRHHHRVAPPALLVRDERASWRRRRALYEAWMSVNTAICLVADGASGEPIGYLVARLCDGPDDTFAVASSYAELSSLAVEPAHRGRGVGTALLDALDQRLEALGISDLTVTVMAGNDDALRLYRRRGLVPAELVLLRLGGNDRL
jgi:ribosomal protein S18 acetylase RimI-like enzyme